MLDNYDADALTTISFSREIPDPPDRRTDWRHVSVLRVGKLLTADREELCLIRNISAGGLMAHVYSALADDEPVSVELKTGHLVTGKVRWLRESMAGIEFDDKIDVLRFLAGEQEDEMRGMTPRAPRLTVDLGARMRIGAHYHHVEIRDISQGGAKIAVAGDVKTNDEAVLTIDGFGALRGTIRWRSDDQAGISFNQPIPFEALAVWATSRNERRSLPGGTPSA